MSTVVYTSELSVTKGQVMACYLRFPDSRGGGGGEGGGQNKRI